ncbi:hypothetical protein PuT2_14785 [Pusillimonas sp. T2]|nr:hypothetical protein PuT2_14785 [Pusillimonas sp. T2]
MNGWAALLQDSPFTQQALNFLGYCPFGLNFIDGVTAPIRAVVALTLLLFDIAPVLPRAVYQAW